MPRRVARTEEIGPFTLFVNEGRGWRYYARPRPGETRFTVGDVAEVRRRQRELRQPQELEWIDDLVPDVGPAARASGLEVRTMPLMRLRRDAFVPVRAPEGIDLSLATPDDDLVTATAVAAVAFGAAGTAVGAAGVDALGAAAADVDRDGVELARERIARGLAVTAVARVKGTPVAVGTHQPLDGAAEIVGVGTLPAFRRRGLGAAITAALAEDAFARGIDVVFLSAGDGTIARVYARVGFRTIGRVGAASPAAD